mmetsp:Transcript_40476/g.89936  ORF Transcript_40476/g.89936 Transcript_40476/m.89936 type:complete len:142 (-) Transcript_40476:1571-1996(-)
MAGGQHTLIRTAPSSCIQTKHSPMLHAQHPHIIMQQAYPCLMQVHLSHTAHAHKSACQMKYGSVHPMTGPTAQCGSQSRCIVKTPNLYVAPQAPEVELQWQQQCFILCSTSFALPQTPQVRAMKTCDEVTVGAMAVHGTRM